MKRTAEVVIIGGGIAGTSIAFYLSQMGVNDVILLERDSLASAATGNTEGFVRMHHTNPWDASMALKGWEVYSNWSEIIGGYCGFIKTGYLLLVGQRDLANLHSNIEMLKGLGINTGAITPNELRKMQPFLFLDDVAGAAYEPEAGYADGTLSVNSLSDRIRESGVIIEQSSIVTGITASNNKIDGVLVGGEKISASIVVIAAGAWSGLLTKTIGVNIPIEARKVSAGILKRPPEINNHMIVMDFAQSRTAFRPEGKDLTTTTIRGKPEKQYPIVDPDNFDRHTEMNDIILSGMKLAHRIPAMENAGWIRTWASVDSFTPDGHPILDKIDGIDGLYIAAGFSGGGFKMGPAIGMCMSELIMEGKASSVDISHYAINRFAKGNPIVGEFEYSNDTVNQLLSK